MSNEAVPTIATKEFDRLTIARIAEETKKKVRRYPIDRLRGGIPTLLTAPKNEYSSMFHVDISLPPTVENLTQFMTVDYVDLNNTRNGDLIYFGPYSLDTRITQEDRRRFHGHDAANYLLCCVEAEGYKYFRLWRGEPSYLSDMDRWADMIGNGLVILADDFIESQQSNVIINPVLGRLGLLKPDTLGILKTEKYTNYILWPYFKEGEGREGFINTQDLLYNSRFEPPCEIQYASSLPTSS